MGIILCIILGLIVGALAKWIMLGKGPGGIVITIAIGIVGSINRRLSELSRGPRHGDRSKPR